MHLHWPIQQPLATCDYAHLEHGQVNEMMIKKAQCRARHLPSVLAHRHEGKLKFWELWFRILMNITKPLQSSKVRQFAGKDQEAEGDWQQALWFPSFGKVSAWAMKGILAAAVTVAVTVATIIGTLTVAPVESLSCAQCQSWDNSCVNVSASECPTDANNSCISSTASSSLGATLSLYQDMSCSAENCSEETSTVTAFAVYVSDNQSFYFASQCCQEGECNGTAEDLGPRQGNATSNIECAACSGPSETSCAENAHVHRCYEGEQCVSLVAAFKNETASELLVLKGCSNISDSTCQFLSAENKTVGSVIFQNFECFNFSTTLPTTVPTTLPTTLSTTTGTGSKASLASLALASLLLLGLLL
ncbi:ly6/PLAUR domain-containing protein 8 [Lemur catta]|uniref:ly6/PLAUR domain-containing protein 8 n=1 Tax=Lemur catta TaxID=9447 RepID=UPI001E2676EF|nr:ly6/PLAUR domain-containing protein 8 [Lemur catta]